MIAAPGPFASVGRILRPSAALGRQRRVSLPRPVSIPARPSPDTGQSVMTATRRRPLGVLETVSATEHRRGALGPLDAAVRAGGPHAVAAGHRLGRAERRRGRLRGAVEVVPRVSTRPCRDQRAAYPRSVAGRRRRSQVTTSSSKPGARSAGV